MALPLLPVGTLIGNIGEPPSVGFGFPRLIKGDLSVDWPVPFFYTFGPLVFIINARPIVNPLRCVETLASDAELIRLNRLFERNPTSTIFARLADTYLVLGQAVEAANVCRRGLKYRPSYLAGHIVLGRALIDMDSLAAAAEEFQKVLTLEHDHLAALEYLALIANRTGDSERVQIIENRLKVLNPFRFGGESSGDVRGQEQPLVSHPSLGVKQKEGPVKTEFEASDLEFPFVSLTLARIYAHQGHRGQAERVVRLVSPTDAEGILDRISHESAT